jgi:DNA-binding FadR family transcriptional regulator
MAEWPRQALVALGRRVLADHRALLDALRAGNPRAAQRLMRRHLGRRLTRKHP